MNNKKRLSLLFLLISLAQQALANDNIIRTAAPISYAPVQSSAPSDSGQWLSISSQYTEWQVSGDAYGCSAWLPSADTAYVNTTVRQARQCNQSFVRTAQAREQNTVSGEIRNSATAIDEFRIDVIDQSQVVAGTLPLTDFSLSTGTLPGGTVNTAYSFDLNTFIAWPNGSADPITWSVESGALPNGVTLSAQGVLSGTPTSVGSRQVTIRATANGKSHSAQYTTMINAQGYYSAITPDKYSTTEVGVYKYGSTEYGQLLYDESGRGVIFYLTKTGRFRLANTNGDGWSSASTALAASQAWVNEKTKVDLYKADGSLWQTLTFTGATTKTLNGYYREGNTSTTHFTEWYANPTMIKSIALY